MRCFAFVARGVFTRALNFLPVDAGGTRKHSGSGVAAALSPALGADKSAFRTRETAPANEERERAATKAKPSPPSAHLMPPPPRVEPQRGERCTTCSDGGGHFASVN